MSHRRAEAGLGIDLLSPESALQAPLVVFYEHTATASIRVHLVSSRVEVKRHSRLCHPEYYSVGAVTFQRILGIYALYITRPIYDSIIHTFLQILLGL